MDSSKSIGSRIKAIRVNKGLTMEDFGKLFNPPANKSLVSKWESGKSLPNNERLKKISEIGNVSMMFLLKGEYSMSDWHIIPDKEKEILKKEFQVVFGDISKKYSDDMKELINDLNEFDFSKLNITQIGLLGRIMNFIDNNDDNTISGLSYIIQLINMYPTNKNQIEIFKNLYISATTDLFNDIIKKD